MAQLVPVLPLTFVAVMLTLLGMRWYQVRQFGQSGLLAWCQSLILSLPLIIYTVLILLGVQVSLLVLLIGLGVAGLAYIWLGNRLRHQPQELSEVSVPPRPPMSKETLHKLQSIFNIDSFYATSISNYQDGAIVKGNLRTDPQLAHTRLTASLRHTLGDDYQLFLVEGNDRRPLVIILPHRPLVPPNLWQKGLALSLVALSATAAYVLGSGIGAGLVVAGGLLLILAVRELALRWTARQHGVNLSLPFVLPSLQLGSFGSFSRFLSAVPSRSALLDLAIAPASASGIMSLVILAGGLGLSAMHYGNLEIPSQVFQASALTGLLAKLFLGDRLHVDFVTIHPLVVLGWVGLVITALNLLPAGQLDGGRIIQAIYGRRTASWTTLISLVLLAIAGILHPLALYWGAIILLLLRNLEPLMLNELSEPEGDRDAMGIFALFWMLLTLLPLTPAVAEYLQIGG